MERKILKELQEWKKSPDRKPLIIRGARQVGKTWSMQEFGKRNYKKTAYINFDNNSRMKHAFSGDFDISRILLALNAETGVDILPEDTLLIFDEIQEVPAALLSLKYFYENAPEYHIVAAGSLLGIALHEGTSFPVGKVDFMNLYPLSFVEYLEATDNSVIAKAIEDKAWDMLHIFHEKCIDLLKQYMYVGGMPAAVEKLCSSNNYNSVRKIQKQLLDYYEQDFSKHTPVSEVQRLGMVWNSIPMQLGKENKKFFYGKIKKGGRAREFEIAIQWLRDCGLIHQIYNISAPLYPLKAYMIFSEFKIYMSDVGLLSAMSDIDAKVILEGDFLFKEFKGALAEQFVVQEIISTTSYTPYYYSSPTGRGEIDIMLQIEDGIVPVEIKASGNVKQAQSLKFYNEKYSPSCAVRTSLLEYKRDDWLTNIPLYAISCI